MKKKGFFRFIIYSLIVLFVLVKLTSSIYVDYHWFKNLGYTELFTTPIIAKLQIGILAFLIYFFILSLMSIIALKVYEKAENEEGSFRTNFRLHVVTEEPEKNVTPLNTKKIKKFLVLFSSIGSLFLAVAHTNSGWLKFLEFRKATDFGIQDSIFNKDIAFYVFKIPLYNFALNSLFSSLIMIFAISVFFFVITGLVKIRFNFLQRGALHLPNSIRKFWAILLSIIFILLGLKRFLAMYSVMYSKYGYIFGAGYTDIHVNIPLAFVLVAIAILGAIASIIFFLKDDHRFILYSLFAYVIIGILGGVLSSFMQYNVSNNEYTMEKPYIEREIHYTRLAYQLDKIKEKDYPGTNKITLENIKNNRPTLDNVRLNDPIPLQAALSQNQGLRYYYRFPDIDIDRYTINGVKRQVLLGPREISEEALTEKAGTFVNMTMRYTHGYGLVATLANEIDASGYAKLLVKDIPPKATMPGIEVKEPRIYYGELTNDRKYGYVIGNTKAKEFDYPLGEDNAENAYEGTTGLKMTPLNKLFLSAYFNTVRFYFAQEITPESKLLMRRNIVERVTTLMPYLSYDKDPYLVVAENGKMYWIIDAYTTTDKFPYSSPIGNFNYIRNSAKVVVDAMNGTVDFYRFDDEDPIINTLSKIYPSVFKDKAELPSNLIEHIRYPEDMFQIQAQMLLNFHVTNPSVFYNREDTWDIAKKVSEGNTVNIEPYYSIMKLPGETESEYALMLPFTPASRQGQHRNNLVSWLAAQNDGDKYGNLILYKMSKNEEILGPLMVESLIDQDTTISGKLTLWSQGGSEIIRGNLLTVPIDDGFVYIEPIYIRAQRQGTSIPQMQAIVFATGQRVIMVETKDLDKAIAEFFAVEGLPVNPEAPPAEKMPDDDKVPETPGATPIVPKDEILKKIKSLKEQIENLEKDINAL